MPNARLNLRLEADIGVLNEAFCTLAIHDPATPEDANWGVKDALPN
jgi:hypothetical protein